MRRLSFVFLALVLMVPALGQAKTWRPPFLDLGDQVVKVGPTKIIRLLGFDPEKEVITNLSVSPDGGYAALVMRSEQSLTLQVVNLRLTGKQSRFALGEAQRGDEDRFVQWAPNSLALMVTESREWASDEIRVSLFPFNKLTTIRIEHSWLHPKFSPDGTCIAYLLPRYRAEAEGKEPGLYYFDLAAGREIFCDDVRGTAYDWIIFGWTNDDRILLVGGRDPRAIPRAPNDLVAFSLADHSRTVHPISWSDPEELSPDGKYYFTAGLPAVYTVAGRQRVSLSDDLELRPSQWDPRGRFLLAWRSDAIKDDVGRVHKELANLWFLKVPQDQDNESIGRSLHNHLLVVVDAEIDRPLHEAMAAVTADRRRIVYVADNQLRTKELKTLKGEQAAAARQDYEQTLQAAALYNAKQIAVALLMYTTDSGGALPDADEILSVPDYEAAEGRAALYDYLKDPRIFSHPEIPEMMCFEYHPPEHLRMDGIADPATTVLGWLDWGREWQVYLYADGHCKVVEKKKR